MAQATRTSIAQHLGDEAEHLLDHECETIPKDQLHLPGPDFVDRVWKGSDRSPQVLRSMQEIFNHGRLGGSGYISILPVDQGIELLTGVAAGTRDDQGAFPEDTINAQVEARLHEFADRRRQFALNNGHAESAE